MKKSSVDKLKVEVRRLGDAVKAMEKENPDYENSCYPS